MAKSREQLHRAMVQKSNLILAWTALGSALLVWAVLLFRLSPNFSYAYEVPDMPIVHFTFLLIAGGVVFSVLPLLLRQSLHPDLKTLKKLLGIIFVIGCALRLVLIFSEPMLEDDYQRYLWDGAQVAHGLNPYTMSPEEAQRALGFTPVGQLAAQSGEVLGRVNHGDLRTVYPPVAQTFFALAYKIAPFQLMGWRIVISLVDLVILGLLFLLLRAVDRSPLWLALYWWNPVVAKEFYNSTHMDVLLIPFVLGALYFAIRGRIIAPMVTLAFGVGVKIWPLFLLPLVLRRVTQPGIDWTRVALGIGLFLALCALWVVPIIVAGFSSGSGLVAYASNWQTNSALFPSLKALIGGVLNITGVDADWSADWSGKLARACVLGLMGGASLYFASGKRPAPFELILRAGFLVLVILLLSPAQFPWYLTWFSPFLVFLPLWGAVFLHALIPFYYLGFYYFAVDNYSFYSNVVVWLLWVPIWGMLIYETLIRNKWSASLTKYLAQYRTP